MLVLHRLLAASVGLALTAGVFVPAAALAGHATGHTDNDLNGHSVDYVSDSADVPAGPCLVNTITTSTTTWTDLRTGAKTVKVRTRSSLHQIKPCKPRVVAVMVREETAFNNPDGSKTVVIEEQQNTDKSSKRTEETKQIDKDGKQIGGSKVERNWDGSKSETKKSQYDVAKGDYVQVAGATPDDGRKVKALLPILGGLFALDMLLSHRKSGNDNPQPQPQPQELPR